MSEPRALVEHFFRHGFGRLVAVLTRSLGLRRLALVEDVVQAALVQALETWSRRRAATSSAALPTHFALPIHEIQWNHADDLPSRSWSRRAAEVGQRVAHPGARRPSG